MDNKKERIIQSAIEVFREKGLEKTKVSDIVKGAGIAQGTFYLYFSSKLSVMLSIAEVMTEKILVEIEAKVHEESPLSLKLEQVVDIVFAITREYRDIFALTYAGLASVEYRQEWEAIYEPYYDWLSAELENAKAAGVIRQSLNPKRTAEILIGLIEDAAEQTYMYTRQDERTAALKKKEVLDFAGHALGLE
ncbi:TetR/AcrR family transcriptional regulator [Lentibacillus cibarius]|uniref:TetR/AcrR family transcriptional regulator n=1 Tax=Lentibacillus cibarius TaxID=2583219 RepID=A0A549YGA7_9BACI|nr:TetR family transcriptional regulator [Lentibacillus cibarius]TRM10930.1 TetR/AcrR family transcriptional regulator [Lentibacillus cibarius]